MSNTNSTHYYKVKYNEAVKNFRKMQLEVITGYSDLKTLEELRAYNYALNDFAGYMSGLTNLHSESRFNKFRTMCREGWSGVFMPEVVCEIEGLAKNSEVYVLVFSEDGSLMGTLTYDDVNF